MEMNRAKEKVAKKYTQRNICHLWHSKIFCCCCCVHWRINISIRDTQITAKMNGELSVTFVMFVTT
jgi:hypothetical protein